MKTVIVNILFLVVLLVGGCAPGQSFDSSLKSIVEPYRFSIARWELQTISGELEQWSFGEREKVDDQVKATVEYFSLVKRTKTLRSEIEAGKAGIEGNPVSHEAELDTLEEQRRALEGVVERTIAAQIRETLSELGIYNPITKFEINFPSLNFKLEKPPYLLIVSPRDRIESIREVTLRQDIRLEQMEDIEAETDKLGVSSLVVEIGGFGGTYPTFVVSDAGLRFTIDTAIEEWLHQYLAFTPLGFRFMLDVTGLRRDYEIATINETVAGMVSREIGSLVYERYYAAWESGAGQEEVGSGFDFNREMREIRKAVDGYLVRGEIELAEEFMKQKRQYLASEGYYIRKLNQAYFAYYGTYADRPASVSPIGLELRELREQSASLKDFLDTVANITNRQDLIRRIR